MNYYIEITKLNSRREFYELAKKLEERGYADNVEYCGAEWADAQVWRVLPHLKFVNEEDALAYVLSYGGKILHEKPTILSNRCD